MREDEQRLTAWMTAHLCLTWAEHPRPHEVELELIASLHPPLNVEGAPPSDTRAHVVAAKAAYGASGGPRPLSNSEPES